MPMPHFEVHANAAATDMLLVHGNLASINWWKPFLEVAERGLKSTNSANRGTIVAVDLRGHGQTPLPQNETLQAKALVDDLALVVEELGLHNVLAIGHSAGGLLTALLAARKPQALTRLILIDPVGPKGLQNVPADIEQKYAMMSADRNVAAQVICFTIHQNDPTRSFFQKEIMDDSMKALKTVNLGLVRALENVDFSHDIAQVRQPFTVFHGAHDWVLSEDNATDYVKLAKQGEFVKLPENGHCLLYENPERLFTEVQKYLR